MEGDDKVVMDNQRQPKKNDKIGGSKKKIDKIGRSKNLLKKERWVTNRIEKKI